MATTVHAIDPSGRKMKLLLVLTAIFGIVAMPKLLAGADSAAATRKGNTLNACRSEYASRVTEAVSARDNLLFEGFVAVVRNDNDTIDRLTAGHPSPAEAARHLVDVRTRQYRRAVALSRTHPDRFLDECKELEP